MTEAETNASINACSNRIEEEGSSSRSESKDDRSFDSPAKRARHVHEHDPVHSSIAIMNTTKTIRKSILKDFNSNALTKRSIKKNTRIAIHLEHNATFLIPTRYEFTPDQIEAMWYHSLERQAMVQGALKIAADLTPNDYMARGLEHYTPEGGTSRYCVRQRLYQRIFQEQGRQRQSDNDNNDSVVIGKEERISAISLSFSRQSQAEANRRAHLDELALIYTNEQVNLLGSISKHNGSKNSIFAGLTQTLRDIGWLGVSPQ